MMRELQQLREEIAGLQGQLLGQRHDLWAFLAFHCVAQNKFLITPVRLRKANGDATHCDSAVRPGNREHSIDFPQCAHSPRSGLSMMLSAF